MNPNFCSVFDGTTYNNGVFTITDVGGALLKVAETVTDETAGFTHIVNNGDKLYANERYLTETLKNIKERNIRISKKMNCDDFELKIVEDNNKVLKIFNYFPTFKKLYKYFI